jgi:hypothetical protein
LNFYDFSGYDMNFTLTNSQQTRIDTVFHYHSPNSIFM